MKGESRVIEQLQLRGELAAWSQYFTRSRMYRDIHGIDVRWQSS